MTCCNVLSVLAPYLLHTQYRKWQFFSSCHWHEIQNLTSIKWANECSLFHSSISFMYWNLTKQWLNFLQDIVLLLYNSQTKTYSTYKWTMLTCSSCNIFLYHCLVLGMNICGNVELTVVNSSHMCVVYVFLDRQFIWIFTGHLCHPISSTCVKRTEHHDKLQVFHCTLMKTHPLALFRPSYSLLDSMALLISVEFLYQLVKHP
jgi:hypothetical protein